MTDKKKYITQLIINNFLRIILLVSYLLLCEETKKKHLFLTNLICYNYLMRNGELICPFVGHDKTIY